MRELEGRRMQEKLRVSELLPECLIEFPESVLTVKNEGMTDCGEVPPDLMVPARRNRTFNVRGIREEIENGIERLRIDEPVATRREFRADGAVPLLHSPHDERAVGFPPLIKFIVQKTALRLLGFGKYHHSGTVEVEAMNDAESRMILPEEIEERELPHLSLPSHGELPAEFTYREKMLVLVEDAVGRDGHERIVLQRILFAVDIPPHSHARLSVIGFWMIVC